MEIQLSSTGQLARAWLVHSAGDPNLDLAALQSAHTSRYSPERSNCESVAGSYLLKVDFSL